jgi:hypothetical protein
MRLRPETESVFRKAKETSNYVQLEQTVPFALLHQTINHLVDDHDRGVDLARERKLARTWTPQAEEHLRHGWKDGSTIGELANELDRAPKAVEHQLIVLGELNRGAIRRAAALKHAADGLDNKAA